MTRKNLLKPLLLVLLLAFAFGYATTNFKNVTRKSKEKAMFKGLRTVIYHVDDLEKAKDWYSKILEIDPYFDQPFYVGFNVGGFELGLDPNMSGIDRGNNVVAYWGVSNADSAFKRLITLGAQKHSDIQEVGGAIRVATVKDPFGNIFGLIENPNFKIESK